MNSTQIDSSSIVVVEGINDEKKLKSINPSINTYVIGGFGLNEENLNFLKEASKVNNIILFLDPDSTGEILRNKIKLSVPNTIDIFVNKEEAISKNGKKIGIEHLSNDLVIKYLSNINLDNGNKNSITFLDLYELELLSKENSYQLRKIISQKLYLGNPNGKQFLSRLNILGITKEKLIEIINDNT